jgi:tripartite-type tricarboxylate transporter receptor subunit TctC
MRTRAALVLACSVALAAGVSRPAAGQGKPFYDGKTVRILISAGSAGAYIQYARLLAAHMGKYLPGNPGFIVQSMPGAGGLVAANYLNTTAPQDGTTIGLIHSTLPLAPLFGEKGARFDPLKFHWLGSLDRSDGMCTAWAATPIATWNDMLTKEFVVGSSGAGSQMDIYPAVLNKLFGTKIKVISGYKDGNDIFLAMERGEVQGRCSPQLTAIQSIRPQWLTEHKIAVPILIAEKRSADFPDTPAIMEFAKDKATRDQLGLLIVTQDMDRPVLAPPKTPPERVAELRAAFVKALADPELRADAARSHLHLDAVRGEDLAANLARAYALPQEIVASARETMSGK